jgi:hypothetical protein
MGWVTSDGVSTASAAFVLIASAIFAGLYNRSHFRLDGFFHFQTSRYARPRVLIAVAIFASAREKFQKSP